MADETGMGHVGLKLVRSDLPHIRLVYQLEALLGASPHELSGSKGLPVYMHQHICIYIM